MDATHRSAKPRPWFGCGVPLLAAVAALGVGVFLFASAFRMGALGRITPNAEQWPPLLRPLDAALEGPFSGQAAYVHGAGDTSIWLHVVCEGTTPEQARDMLLDAGFAESPSAGAAWHSPEMLGEWSRAPAGPTNRDYVRADGPRVLLRPSTTSPGVDVLACYGVDSGSTRAALKVITGRD